MSGNNESGSKTSLPKGLYSSEPGRYTPHSDADAGSTAQGAAVLSVESVRVTAVSDRITMSFDPDELATRRMIRKLNER